MSSLDIITTENEQFKENYPKMMKKIKTKKLVEFEPTLDEITKVYNIILDYIKIKNRKIYGGYGLNKLLIDKDAKLAIYEDMDTPDIEFYSPDPIGDLVKICGLLHKKGFKQIMGQEAQHKETYTIYVNYLAYCDITYMPINIYNKIRYINLDELNFIHPWFMMIDFFRMFTDPMLSYWRLEKHFERYKKLEKYYSLPKISKSLTVDTYKNITLYEIINLLEDFLVTRSNIIFTGFYVYNYYLKFCKYDKRDTSYKQIQIPYLEVYSTEYVIDGLSIIEFIKTLPENISSKIIYEEYYPFFQFYGYNTVFYYNEGYVKKPILYIYSNNNKCIPYKEVQYVKFDNVKNKYEIRPNIKMNIGSFEFNILHYLIILVKARIDDNKDINDIIYKYINGLVIFRKYYLKQNNLNNIFEDDSLFQGFVIECKGKTISPDREKRLLIQHRRKLGKPLVFRYEPETSKKPGAYNFQNSSGNIIKNNLHLKLTEENINKKYEDELENDENIEEKKDIKKKDIKKNKNKKKDDESGSKSDDDDDDDDDDEESGSKFDNDNDNDDDDDDEESGSKFDNDNDNDDDDDDDDDEDD